MDILEEIDKFDEGGADQPSTCDQSSTVIEVEPTGEVSYPKDHRPANKPLTNTDDATRKTPREKEQANKTAAGT